MSETDFASMMEPVARELWGEPNAALSNQREIRWGSGGGRAVNVEKGVWTDWTSGANGEPAGGGVLDLVMQELGCEKREALEWLESEGYIQPREDRSASQPRQESREAVRAPEPPPEEEGAADEPTGEWVAVKGYRYTNRDGEPVYEVIRKHFRLPDGTWKIDPKTGNPAKTFGQRHKGPDGHYINTIKGIPHTIYRHPEVERAIADGKTVALCYAPDTEVLTPTGWVAFPSLQPGTSVAQYDLATGSVSFCIPKAHQRFRFTGEMVNIKSTWCDLLVTPDHRQPYRNTRTDGTPCPARIGPASAIRGGHRMPAAGRLHGGRDVQPAIVRLLVAWLADGVWEPRGDYVSWNLKKVRKCERLRQLLLAAGLVWSEHDYPSTVGWHSFRVRKDVIGVLFEVGPDKRWPWEMLSWSLESRTIALEELGHWDGDTCGTRMTRFFTGERQSAEVVSALASISGKGSGLRVDRRPEKNDSYVVSLNDQDWRKIASTPARVTYDGEVFCCTVDTGVLVVRRNGKVTISGNCEGEKDVETLEALGWTATTNSGGAGNWRPDLAEIFRGADVVIMVDNDDVGRAAGEARAKTLRGIAARIRVLDFAEHVPDFPAKGDVSDWVAAGGDASKLGEIINKLPDWRPAPPSSKFRAVRPHEFNRPDLRHESLVEDVLDRKGLAAIAGESQGGKSFLTMHLCGCIAANLKFFDREVMPGLVVYQAGEGEKGLGKRMKAWMQQNGIEEPENLPLVTLPRKINLFVDDKDADDLIAECKAWEAFYGQKLRLVIIDTFNKASRGMNEISGQDVGRVIERMERIAEECDCLVLFVHHMNAGGARVRGHTSLLDDLNNLILVKKLEIGDQNQRPIRTWTLTKNKDGENGKITRFILRQVILEDDLDGKQVTTCVTDLPAGSEEEARAGYRLTDQERVVYSALVAAAADFGKPVPYELRLPASVNVVVETNHWRDQVRKTWSFKEIDSDTEEQRKIRQEVELAAVMKRVGMNLFNAGVIGKNNDKKLVWLTGKEVKGFRRHKAAEPTLTRQQKADLADMDVPF